MRKFAGCIVLAVCLVHGGFLHGRTDSFADGFVGDFTSEIADGPAAARDADDYVKIGKDARWNEPRPDLPDLSVQYISRTPRFPGLRPKYVEVKNDVDGEGPTGPVQILNEKEQRWPKPGQEVTFTAAVRNAGNKSVAGFSYAWLYDGRDVETKRYKTPLLPGQRAEFVLKRKWEDGPHHIAFQVDREDRLVEICEENNWVIDRTDALSFAFFVEEGVAEYFKTVRNGLGSYCFEDWAQFQVRQMNKEFRDSIYPTCPEGIIERVRLDRVYVISDGWGSSGGMHTPDVVVPVDVEQPYLVQAQNPPAAGTENFNNVIGGVDGVWGFAVDLLKQKPEWGGKNFYDGQHRWLTGSEWPLHHELGHQLGRADHYLLPNAKEANAAVPGLAYEPPADVRDSMMYSGNHSHDDQIGRNKAKWDSTYRFYCEHEARSFNRDKGVRRGLFGEYLLDVPKKNTFVFLDAAHEPLADAQVEIFVAKGRGYTNPGFNAAPQFTGRTDGAGAFALERGPWNHVFIWCSNGVVLFRVTPKTGKPLVGFLGIQDFNLAHWRGHADAARFEMVCKEIPAATPR